MKLHDAVKLHLCYLDDGTLIGLKPSLLQYLESFSSHSPHFGVHLNFSKYELFWPSGDSFPEFTTSIKHVSKYLELLGSPIFPFLISTCQLILPKLQLIRIALLFKRTLKLSFIYYAAAWEAVRSFIFFARFLSMYFSLS